MSGVSFDCVGCGQHWERRPGPSGLPERAGVGDASVGERLCGDPVEVLGAALSADYADARDDGRGVEEG